MSRAVFDHLLATAKTAHGKYAALSEFCLFPEDLVPVHVTARNLPPAQLMAAEDGLSCRYQSDFRDAFIKAGPHAFWRETYKETKIGDDFMNRFGCYCLIGEGGGWLSKHMQAYVVYMPAGLHYPWHQHPAEELYYVVAGEGEFHRQGEASEILGEGQSSFHASNQPHALTTHDSPVMAYVLWRNHFDVKPAWSDPNQTGTPR